MFAHELYEQNKPRVVVTYPGRFQPFHQGHAGVFAQLQKKFGNENVFIVTSNDTSSAKSPFNFNDKYQLITAAGVPGNHIIQADSKGMYKLPEGFDPANTVFVTALGAPDAERLSIDTFYQEFTKSGKKNSAIPQGKKAGDPVYFKTWGRDKNPATADQHGYVVVIPEIHKTIKIKGKDYDVSHGTECRNLWNQIRKNAKARSEFLTQMYSRPSQELAAIFDKIPATANEDIMPDGAGTASPIPGHLEEMGGVGVIASKKQANDPRYSTSLTQDVRPGAIQKSLRAFKLAEQPHMPLITPPGIKTPQQQAAAQLGYGEEEDLQEKWTTKYKKSINCSNPKGFSQKAHCAGRRARQSGHNTKSKSVSEGQSNGVSYQEVLQMLSDFLPLAAKHLELDKLPQIKIQKHLEAHDGQATFGRFVNDELKIYLGIADRHPVDILRTLAHELVHFKQYLDGEMYPGAGETGTPIENEANAEAGVIMRHFNKQHPDAVQSKPLDL